jgi:hypothetical protein
MNDKREQELMRAKGFEMDREGDYRGPLRGMHILSRFDKAYPWRACFYGAELSQRNFANPIAAATWLQQMWWQRQQPCPGERRQ